MYDGLTPLFDQVTNADLTTYFKSERFGVDTPTPSTIETVPRAGVTIERDSYNVPHVTGATHDDGVWAAGWIAAEDRGLLLEQARYNARVAAIDAPGLDALGLISGAAELRAQRRRPRPRSPSRASVLEARRARGPGGPARHRRLHHRDQRLPRDPQRLDASRRGRATTSSRSTRSRASSSARAAATRRGAREFLAGLQQRLGKKKGIERLQRPAPVQEPRAVDLGRRPLPLRLDPRATPRAA